MFSFVYNEIIYRPLLNLLVFFYNYIPGHDLGVAIILVTIAIRLAMLPSFHKSLKNQKALADLQPKLTELREKHKDNKEVQAKAMMELYKHHNINPLSSCLPLLIQLPVFIALYKVFGNGLKNDFAGLYGFIGRPETINLMFLGFLDLSKSSLLLAVLAALAQFVQSKMMLPKTAPKADDMAGSMNQNMLYMMPIMTIVLAWQFHIPNGLLLYWLATTVFSVAQQYFVVKQSPKTP